MKGAGALVTVPFVMIGVLVGIVTKLTRARLIPVLSCVWYHVHHVCATISRMVRSGKLRAWVVAAAGHYAAKYSAWRAARRLAGQAPQAARGSPQRSEGFQSKASVSASGRLRGGGNVSLSHGIKAPGQASESSSGSSKRPQKAANSAANST